MGHPGLEPGTSPLSGILKGFSKELTILINFIKCLKIRIPVRILTFRYLSFLPFLLSAKNIGTGFGTVL